MQTRTIDPARLAVFWFGIQIVWGALLGVSLQSRSAELAHANAVGAYGLLAASGAAVAALTQIAAGIVSDRRVRRGSRRIEFYFAGAAAAACGIVWFYLASSFTQAFAAVLLLQFGMNVAIGPYQAAIPDHFEDRRFGRASSWMAAFQSLGNACGAIVAGIVASRAFVAAAVAGGMLLTAAFTGAYVARFRAPAPREDRFELTRAWTDLFVSRAFVYLGFYTVLGYLFFFMNETLGAAHARAFTAYALLAVTIAGAIGAAAAARPADAFDRRAVAACGGGLFVLCVIALFAAHTPAAVLLCAACAGAAWGVFLSADWALGCRFVPPSHAATALAVWNLALLLPQIAAPIVATLAIRSAHVHSQALVAFACAAVEVAIGIAWLGRLPAQRKVIG